MKKQKDFCLMVSIMAMVVFMGVGFTSCLNTDDSNRQITGSALATIESDFAGMEYFRLGAGEKLIPTTQIDPSKLNGVKKVFLSYIFESTEEIKAQELIQNPQAREYHVSIIYLIDLEEKVNVLETHDSSIAADSLTTKCYAPIKSIDSLTIKDNYLTAWVNYDMSGDRLHYITLFRYQTDGLKPGVAGAPDTLDVYLGHSSAGDIYNSTTSGNFAYSDVRYAFVYFKAFNLTSIVNSGVNPSNLVLNVIAKQLSKSYSNDTINVSYPVKYEY
ncbi:hypothetical protein EZS27_017047 [termite gut metagenome]|uniref:NigD-like C-terminal beta sandwich domain-containing protein n=1 Tax=termite gut metagenome TaxID=433724 RepID=A0A5J4RLW8_9ZZZZ